MGIVVTASADLGIGYVEESKTGKLYGFSRRFLGERVFSALRVGEHVEFYENGHNSIASLAE